FLWTMRQNGSAAREQADLLEAAPLVLMAHEPRGIRIIAVNAAAHKAGAYPGQALNDARAACPSLSAENADNSADQAMLLRLANAAMRYTPIVALDGEAGLLLDITGCAHLFGGEEKLIKDCRHRLSAIGFSASLGLAPTPLAARVLARFGSGADILESGGIDALDVFPVEALGLNNDRNLLLKRLGLKHIGDVKAVPRAALERRFRSKEEALSVRLALDRLSGDVAEAIKTIHPPEPYRFALNLAEPLIDHVGVGVALDQLLVAAYHRLETEGLGARVFHLTAFRADGGTSSISIKLSEPARDVARIGRLFAPHLPEIDCGHGVDAFVLAARFVEPVAHTQKSMVQHEGGTHFCDGLAPLVDTLNNRLGQGHVFAFAPCQSHLPERAQKRVSALSGASVAEDWALWAEAHTGSAPRPFRLFSHAELIDVMASVPDGPPVRFIWRRVTHKIIRATGPERIAPEWWRAGAEGVAVRDYYAVEDEAGRRFWLYRAGAYDAAEPPRWYVHGVFA
ncbi:MAG: Y-family DNA polymerase, partial [Notoacmeibacter sp.]